MSVRKRMRDLAERTEVTSPRVVPEDSELWRALAGVATLLYDPSQDDSLDDFIADLKNIVSKDRTRFRTMLRRFTVSKAKRVLKTVGRGD